MTKVSPKMGPNFIEDQEATFSLSRKYFFIEDQRIFIEDEVAFKESQGVSFP